MCEQPVGHMWFISNQECMCSRCPPWPQPWHQTYTPLTGSWQMQQCATWLVLVFRVSGNPILILVDLVLSEVIGSPKFRNGAETSGGQLLMTSFASVKSCMHCKIER